MDVPEAIAGDLLNYLLSTSAERARIIGELHDRNPGMAEVLIELEADDNLRARVKMELLNGTA